MFGSTGQFILFGQDVRGTICRSFFLSFVTILALWGSYIILLAYGHCTILVATRTQGVNAGIDILTIGSPMLFGDMVVGEGVIVPVITIVRDSTRGHCTIFFYEKGGAPPYRHYVTYFSTYAMKVGQRGPIVVYVYNFL